MKQCCLSDTRFNSITQNYGDMQNSQYQNIMNRERWYRFLQFHAGENSYCGLMGCG
jgi:hypothetical protein